MKKAGMLAGLVALLLSWSAEAAVVYEVELEGPIFHPAVEILRLGLEQASEAGADAILVRLDTPGGSLDATREIVQLVLGAPLPVIVWVGPPGAGAVSAGTFITLSAHVAAMAPGTTIGAAHPVSPMGGGEGKQAELMNEKAENYASSLIAAIAAERDRDTEWAEKAVRESDALTADEALEKGVIDFIAPTVTEVLAQATGRKVSVGGQEVVLAVEGADRVAIDVPIEHAVYFFLSQPTVVFLLLLIGLGGVYFEVQAPGTLVPGTIGVVALVLAAIGFSIIPVNAAGAALAVLGLALLVTEIFVPSFGILGVAGLACLVGGSLLLFRTAEAPGLEVNQGLIAAIAVAGGAFVFVVGSLVWRSERSPVATGSEGMEGLRGEVRRVDGAKVWVFVAGELWEAVAADGEAIPEVGESVEVVAIEGLRLRVRPFRRN